MTDSTPIKARPTLYAGIQMRSRLEARFAEKLDRTGLPWAYEPDCFAGPHGQYLPDFRVDAVAVPRGYNYMTSKSHPGGVLRGRVYIEVKPFIEAAAFPTLRDKMMVIRESEPSAALAMWVPHDDPDLRGLSIMCWPGSERWDCYYLSGHCGHLMPEPDMNIDRGWDWSVRCYFCREKSSPKDAI